MAHHPIPDPEAVEPIPCGESRVSGTPGSTGEIERLRFASELTSLAARFSSEQGGNLPPEVAADLALEIVLSEIAEQACRLTGASGAAVILERNQEWVCRASSGVGAPELGARLGDDSGLTARCINTRQVQRCSDTETDARVDVQACRTLGVRSLIMVPVWHEEKLAGVFAAFSPRVAAFGEEDERTLKMLASVVTSGLVPVVEAVPAVEQPTANIPTLEDPVVKEVRPETPVEVHHPGENRIHGGNGIEHTFAAVMEPSDQFEPQRENEPQPENQAQPEIVPLREEMLPGGRHRGVQIATWTMTGVVLAFTVFLTAVAMQHWLGKAPRANQNEARSVPAGRLATSAIKEPHAAEAVGGASPAGVPADAAESARLKAHALNAQSKEGGLTVYENGKEIFRMAPTAAAPERTESDANSPPASAVEEIYELPPDDAEGSVLYRVEPSYPDIAREQKIQGTVVLDVWAGPDGSVRSVKLLSGERSLSDAAIAAVKQWKFRPRLIAGQPMAMRTQVTLNFKLPN